VKTFLVVVLAAASAVAGYMARSEVQRRRDRYRPRYLTFYGTQFDTDAFGGELGVMERRMRKAAVSR
jgi:hypothetical protein